MTSRNRRRLRTKARPHPLRVIFDRSAFHEDRFDLLRNSPLAELTAEGRVWVFLTPIFLNETLAAYGAQRRVEWQQHLAYALDVCKGIFLEKTAIWREELVMGRGPFARHLPA